MQSCMNGFGSITKLNLSFLSKSDQKNGYTVIGSIVVSPEPNLYLLRFIAILLEHFRHIFYFSYLYI